MQSYTQRQMPFGTALTPWVKGLLIANTVAFFLSWVIGLDLVVRWLAFAPSAILTRPWGIVTYMFLHGDFWHLFVNMLVLFFFGPPLERRWGSREFVKYYFLCGLGGVALSFVFASGAWVIGASAAMYGLMLAFAMIWPTMPIYIWGIFPVQARWLVAFLFVVTVMSAFGGSQGGVAHFAHLGGIVAGFLYLKRDLRPGVFRSGKPRGKARGVRVRRMAIVSREEGPGQGADSAKDAGNWSPGEAKMLDEVDRILDKISAKGMASLTDRERKILDEVSRKHRSN